MNGRVCSIFSVATVLPSTFGTPILADSAIVSEHHYRSSQTVIFEVKLKLVHAGCQLRSLPTHALEIDQIPGEHQTIAGGVSRRCNKRSKGVFNIGSLI